MKLSKPNLFALPAAFVIVASFMLVGVGSAGGLRIALAEQPHAHEEEQGHEEHEVAHHEDAGHEDAGHREIVRLSVSQMEEFGVKVEPAGIARITTYVVLPGEVVPNADRVAHIVPRYAGIVTEVRARVGDAVKTGDVLALIESSQSLTPYELTTLLDGTVIAKHITRGEAVTRESQAFVIADLTKVWLEFSIYQRDLNRVTVDQQVLVSAGHHFPDVEGTISYVSPIVDEDTRTASARLVMDNSNGVWRPGMFVTGRVAVNAVEVPVAAPHTALHTVEGRTVVFVQDDDGFTPRRVEIGRTSTTHAEILSGLSTGERYATVGGFIIKAELGRSELSEGHAH